MTQFGRAMSQLGVKLTCAKSPQAKGRVERMNGTLQDRLVKALRLAGINTINAANTYLEQKFLTQLNQRFMVAPASAADAHLAVSEAVLHASLCVQQQRTVGRDHCVSWQGRVLQLKPPKALASLAGKCVTVQQALDATVSVHWREQTVAWQAVDQRPHAVQSAPSLPSISRLANPLPTTLGDGVQRPGVRWLGLAPLRSRLRLALRCASPSQRCDT